VVRAAQVMKWQVASASMLEELSEDQWRHWEEQGYVRLGVQLSAAEVAQLQQRCNDLRTS